MWDGQRTGTSAPGGSDRIARSIEALLDSDALAVVMANDHGILHVNAEAARLAGDSVARLLATDPGRHGFEMVGEGFEPLASDEAPWTRARREGRTVRSTVGFRDATHGERRWALVVAHPTGGPDGEVLSLAIDVTERARNVVLREAHAFVFQAIAEGLTFEGVLERVCEAVERAAPEGRCAVTVRDPDGVPVVAAPSCPEGFETMVRSFLAGGRGTMMSATAAQGDDVELPDLGQVDSFTPFLSDAERLGLRAYWGTPVRVGDSVVGVIGLLLPEARPATDHERAVTRSFVPLVQVALERARDDHRLRSSRSQAQASRDELGALIDAAPFVVCRVDAAGTVHLWNRTAETILGWPRDQVQGREVPFGPPPERDALLDAIEAVSRGAHVDAFDTCWEAADGSPVDVNVVLTSVPEHRPTSSAGRSDVLVIASDIRERRRLEAQFLRAQRMEAIGRLAGQVAHDFNNLLGVIVGNVDFLLDTIVDPDAREELETIRLAADRATDLTHQLLAVGSRQDVTPRLLDVNAAITGALPMLTRLVGEDVDVEFSPGHLEGSVRLDPLQLEQILLNLAVNARDAMPEGGRIGIRTGTIDIAGPQAPAPAGTTDRLEPGRWARVEVTDTGLGMDAETAARAFEPLFTTKTAGGGTGLGLSAVYGIVEQAGGHIHFDSAPDAGTSFTILLPLVDAPALEPPPPDTPVSEVGGRGEAVLLCEDETGVRTVARKALEKYGYVVCEAADGAEALAAIESGFRPDVLVTDVVLPGFSGVELGRQIQARLPGTPVLLTSGFSRRARIGDADLSPRAEFLAKPFRPGALLAAVRELLEQVARRP